MAITVSFELGYELKVKAKATEVFAVLSDIPQSVKHFPSVEQLSDLGDGAYQWTMEKIGTAQLNLQTVYASQYTSDKVKGWVKWTPIKGIGNALVSGHWKIKEGKSGTALELEINGEVHIPLPALMKMVVAPIVETEFERLVEQYIDNLIVTFGGEV